MTDIVRIAIEHRVMLKSELLELEEFIRTAEMLLSSARERPEGDQDGDQAVHRHAPAGDRLRSIA